MPVASYACCFDPSSDPIHYIPVGYLPPGVAMIGGEGVETVRWFWSPFANTARDATAAADPYYEQLEPMEGGGALLPRRSFSARTASMRTLLVQQCRPGALCREGARCG